MKLKIQILKFFNSIDLVRTLLQTSKKLQINNQQKDIEKHLTSAEFESATVAATVIWCNEYANPWASTSKKK